MNTSNKSPKKLDIKNHPIDRQLGIADKLVDIVSEKAFPDKRTPLEERLAKLTNEQKSQLQEIEDRAFMHFVGQFDELESAVGMLRMGHHVGWKVLYMIHSKKTIRKYEEILDIKIRELFPEKGPSANRSVGLAFAEKFSNFWKVVSGEIKIEDRRKID